MNVILLSEPAAGRNLPRRVSNRARHVDVACDAPCDMQQRRIGVTRRNELHSDLG